MKLTDFDYHLPQERIAQVPIEPRDSSRLLILGKKSGKIQDKIFHDIAEELWENDVLVVNKTRVINARLKGWIEKKRSPWIPLIKGDIETEWRRGITEVEIFLHKQIDDTHWDCLVYPGKKLKPGTKVYFDTYSSPESSPSTKKERNNEALPSFNLKGRAGDGIELSAIIKSVSEKWRIVKFNIWGLDFLKIVEEIWSTPLPPYIKETLEDGERYQTVYNQIEGSSAAPTAWLHFTDELLEKLEQKWVRIEKVLLHVGLGTFANVETEDIENHHMHKEYIELEDNVATKLNNYKQNGKRIIAIGTTSIRVLESFSDENWNIQAWSTETDIFIYPGYNWKFVDSLITNFHLPKSTLMMLVSSLAGKENIEKAYKHAINEEYRFFSFGDAMWIR